MIRGKLFCAGLAPRVVKHLERKGMLAVIRRRQSTVAISEATSYKTWSARPHQVEALEAIRKYRRGLIQHATGAGKSDLIGFTAHIVGEAKTLIVASSKSLLHDLASRCRKFDINYGLYGNGYKDLSKRVTIVIDDNLRRLPKEFLSSVEVLLVDETHGAAAESVFHPLMECTRASVRLGFSATALDRSDQAGMFIVGLLGGTIHKFTPAQATSAGMIARAHISMPVFRHAVPVQAASYVEWERAHIAHNRLRNLRAVAIVDKLVEEGHAPCIVFVRTHEHQAVLSQMFGAACRTVNDKTKTADVVSILKEFQKGIFPILISTPILRQGVDMPAVRSVVNLSAGKATIDIIQKVGRGSRRFQADGSEKEDFRVVDLADAPCEYCKGDGHQVCRWVRDHTKSRRAAYEAFGYTVQGE